MEHNKPAVGISGAAPGGLGAARRKSAPRSLRAGGCSIVMIFFAAIVFSAVAGGCGYESGKETEKLSQAQEQIMKFRKGEEWSGDAGAYLSNGRPDAAALAELRAALGREEEKVREQICRLLADIGKRADPLFPKGGNIIRDRAVIGILAGEGLSRETSARDLCAGYLQDCVPAPALKEYGRQLSGNLKMWPDTRLLLVIAKAKPPEASEAVDSLMKIPAWAKRPETMIAAAALGDREIENDFIRRFREAAEPKEKADAAKHLGFIGTPAALAALADGMRTPLVIEKAGVSRRSVRIFVIDALRHNYPDRTFLYSNAVRSDADYEVIEKFCEETFGTKWKEARPPFLWIQGYPSEPPKGR